MKNEIFQNRGRPQGNINKKGNREFSYFFVFSKICIFNPSLKSNLVNKVVTGKRDVEYNLAQVT